jgi:hypothetical protein
VIDIETFERLLTPVACGISLYMPIDPDRRDKRAPEARLRNLVGRAQALVAEVADSEQLVRSLESLLETTDFARHRDPGLAAFATLGRAAPEVIPLPRQPSELVVAGTDFHIKPLLPLNAAKQRFGILALSKARVRLLIATPFSLGERELEALPVDVQAELDSRPAAERATDADAVRMQLLAGSPQHRHRRQGRDWGGPRADHTCCGPPCCRQLPAAGDDQPNPPSIAGGESVRAQR